MLKMMMLASSKKICGRSLGVPVLLNQRPSLMPQRFFAAKGAKKKNSAALATTAPAETKKVGKVGQETKQMQLQQNQQQQSNQIRKAGKDKKSWQ